MIRFLDFFKQDKNIHKPALKKISKLFKRGDFILGKEVELFEKNSDILKAASGSNQYRVHRGYHYPRSKDTVIGIINSEQSFLCKSFDINSFLSS